MEEIKSKQDAIKEIVRVRNDLHELALSNESYVSKCGSNEKLLSYVICNILPQYYYLMTEAEKKSYVLSFLEDPLLPPSFMLVTIVTSLQSKRNSKEEASLLLIFLKSRINSLIEEMTCVFEESGTALMLFSEHIETVTNYLLHLPDIISNLFPDCSLSFFTYQTYVDWFSEHLLQVYYGFTENRDMDQLKRLVKKSCILGYAKSIGKSFCSILHSLAGDTHTNQSLLRSLSRQTLLDSSQQFVSLIPDLRIRDFILTILLDATESHPSSQYLTILSAILFQSSLHIDHIAFLIIRYSFTLSNLILILHSFYHNSIHSSLFNTFIQTLINQFASTSFVHLSTSQQTQLTSVLYCLVSLKSIKSPETLDAITHAIGHRLSSEHIQVRNVVIGIARIVASQLTPEKEYDWPTVDLSELDAIVNSLQDTTPGSQHDPLDTPIQEKSPISVIPKTSKYLDPDEIVNVFIEEEYQYLDPRISEELTESSDLTDLSDLDDEFLPYDLTEETITTTDYSHLEDAISDLSSDDHFTRLKVWNAIRTLVRTDDCLMDSLSTKTVLGILLEMNGLVGCEDFWSQWTEVISVSIYRQCDSSMTYILHFLRENGRNNLPTVKCLALLQAISHAAKMLFMGTMEIPDINDIPKETTISITTQEEDGMIRVANTKYKPSYYRKQILQKADTKISHNSGIPEKRAKNEYSKMSQRITEPLLTWCLRFPPRDESCIACLLFTLSYVFTLPVLTAVFDASYRDIAAVILRYRFHKSAQIRRGSMELFIATTQYEYRENVSDITAEVYEKKRVIEWMNRVISDDCDEVCRDLAVRILSQLRMNCSDC